MKLSSKTITAIKLFIDLGEHYQEGYISLKDVSNRKDVSKKFLEQIVPIYKTNGLLIGNRGNQGGYKLAKDPQDISLKDIIFTLETSFYKEEVGYLSIDDTIARLDVIIDDFFSNISLSQLIEKQKESYSYDYSI